jgi:hypothetical protein
MASPLDDPTLSHGVCKTCGIPVKTSSVNVYYNKLNQPIYGRNVEPHNWEHYIPNTIEGEALYEYHRANNTDINHVADPATPRTHDDDAERIQREGRMGTMEEGFKLSRQFNETLGRD